MASTDNGGTWTVREPVVALGIAVNPDDPDLILAAGQGTSFSGILVSRDGGRSWAEVQAVPAGAGPTAWATDDPEVGYVVGFDRQLYRTDDRGATWSPVDG